MQRRSALAAALVAILALAAADAAAQAAYPNKPVSLIVPFPAGGRTDLIARMVAQPLAEQLKVAAVVVNRPGASSVLGSQEVAQARPDGYTVGFFSSAAVTAQYTVPTPMNLADYELVSIVNVDPAAVAVQAGAPWKTLAELVAFARKNPEQVRIGMIPGASAQIFAGGLAQAADIRMINVPFKGDADGAIALAGGHIEAHTAVPV